VALYFHSPDTPSWCGDQLKHRDFILLYFGFMEWYLITHSETFNSLSEGTRETGTCLRARVFHNQQPNYN
jgi:hypothetical protein